MEVSKQVHQFTSVCERLLAAMANKGLNAPFLNGPLNEKEKQLVRFYCSELVENIESSPANPKSPDQQ